MEVRRALLGPGPLASLLPRLPVVSHLKSEAGVPQSGQGASSRHGTRATTAGYVGVPRLGVCRLFERVLVHIALTAQESRGPFVGTGTSIGAQQHPGDDVQRLRLHQPS
jgi:hypothetical protein